MTPEAQRVAIATTPPSERPEETLGGDSHGGRKVPDVMPVTGSEPLSRADSAAEACAVFPRFDTAKCIMSYEEAAKFRKEARRMVYFVHEDGRVLLDDDGSQPVAPAQGDRATIEQAERIVAEGIANGDHPKTIVMKLLSPAQKEPEQLRTLTPHGIVDWVKRSEESLKRDPRKIGSAPAQGVRPDLDEILRQETHLNAAGRSKLADRILTALAPYLADGKEVERLNKLITDALKEVSIAARSLNSNDPHHTPKKDSIAVICHILKAEQILQNENHTTNS